jgi:hypothetical protein
MDNLIENDGIIYCISYNDKVKIGKTKMLKTEEETLTKLLTRYSTYHPDCVLFCHQRVGNTHKAEHKIFNILESIHYKGEHFYFNKELIRNAFVEIKTEFLNINDYIRQQNVENLTSINQSLRKKK